MSDADELTSKEAHSAKQEEKEKDTAGSRSSKSGGSPRSAKSGKSRSGVGSKPGSAASGKAKLESPALANKRSSSRASASSQDKPKTASSIRDGETSRKASIIGVPVFPEPDEGGGLPAHVIAIFLTSKTQEIFSIRGDEDVTKESPFKTIPKAAILEDIKKRAGVSDLSVLKQQINAYVGTDLLVGYDADFVFGQNYIIALTEEAKELLLTPPKVEVEGSVAGIVGEDGEIILDEDIVYKYVPPQPKDWVSQGSELEIDEEKVQDSRKTITLSIQRVRREFGAPVEFSDRNVADAKDGYIECTPFEDKTFELKKMELDKSVQAVPDFLSSSSQTDWKYPRNAYTQYYPREFNDKEKENIQKSESLLGFINNVTPRFELSLQQNEILDVFNDDWMLLGDGDDTFGSKADNHLKEYQSFTDLLFSKEKTITDIEWHPTIKGVVAVSVSERMYFDDRIENAARVIMTPSLILIWSFTDPIHPQLLLEAPDDIHCFKFCPSDPNIITGGCHNGQVVLWDISAHTDRLKQPRGSNRSKKANTLPGFEDEKALKTPIVRYCAVSSIESSHKAPITDILWVPDHFEVNRMGVPTENRTQQCCQIMTCATDYCVTFWDTRPAKGHQAVDDKVKTPMGVPNTFKHLDLNWKPLLKVTLHKSEPGGDHSPMVFSIRDVQGDRSAVVKAGETLDSVASSTGNYPGFNRPGSGKDKQQTLNSVKTFFYVGTEDGELVYADWMPQKDQDTGKIQTPKPEYYHALHDGPIVGMKRSPFFRDVVLCVGGWSFSIWKEGVNSGPILHSAASPVRLTAAHWSPSRPGVFYVARMDGSVDVWDLLDKTHEPSLNQNVSAVAITAIYPFPVTAKQHLLGVGDSSGTLHILEIPWSLRQMSQNEVAGVSNYFEREVRRRAFVVARWDYREQEKRDMENESKRKAGIAPLITLADEELEARSKIEYQQYIDDEAIFLRSLGLKDDSDVLGEA